MELLQLKYFCDAAKTENFSKTARKFMVPASNISQMINRLENELGTQLFDRTANKIRLNKYGMDFYERVNRALLLIEEAKTSVCDDEISGEISICICTGRRVVTKVIEKFKKIYPDVSFVIHHTIPDETDSFDIIVSDEIKDEKNYVRTELIRENIILVMKNDNPLLNAKKINAENLSPERFITMSPPSSLYKYTMSVCESMGFYPQIAIQSDDPYYVRKYVSLGLGVAFVPEISWEGLFDSDVAFRKMDNFTRTTYIFHSKKKFMTKRTELFIKALTE